MKRRKFIKALALSPVVLALGKFLPEIKLVVDDEATMLDLWVELHGMSRKPGENNSNLRSRLIEFKRFDHARRSEAVVNSYFQMIIKKS